MTGMGTPEFIGRVAVVEQAGKSVRVLLHEGETLYSAKDILTACGKKYPAKWCLRESEAQSSVKLTKLPFPVNGKSGGTSRRYCPMYFTSEECGRMILDMVGCDKGVRAWLEKEVFAFKIEDKKPKPAPPAETVVQQPEPSTAPVSMVAPMPARNDYLDKKIDEMLFALLDLKKYIAHQQI